MKNSLRFMMLSGLLIMMGCAANRVYTWQDVTRVVEPTIPTYTPQGHLVVYTEQLDESTSEDSYYPYSAYTIYNPEGKRIKRVENHSSREDRYPETVQLAPGKYVIVPERLMAKRDIVGAIVEDGKTTEIRFQDN